MKEKVGRIGDSIRETMDDELREKNNQVPVDEEPKETGKPKTGKAANSRYVRLRKGPSSSAQVITNMNLGEEAIILDRLPGYYKIQTEKGGHVGYVASNYFKED